MAKREHIVSSLLSFLYEGVSIAVLAILAAVTHTVLVFPSLGPSALLFFAAPLSPGSSPRNAITGHAIGCVVGYLSLMLTGLTQAAPALSTGMTEPRIIAVSFALATTGFLMAGLRIFHPPAAATALMVALGILSHPGQLLGVMLAVLLLTVQAWMFNRLVGIPYPLWSPTRQTSSSNDARNLSFLDTQGHVDSHAQTTLEAVTQRYGLPSMRIFERNARRVLTSRLEGNSHRGD